MSGRVAKLAGVCVGLTVALAAAGCDASDSADPDNGRQLFNEHCGQCHILAEAGTSGTAGPDLDAAFADARASGMDADTIAGVVKPQIANPRFTDPDNPAYMPPDLVTGDDARDVAAYVGDVAGVPGIEPPEAPGGSGGQVFADNGCGSCHTLAAAQSGATIGPDLDEVLPGQNTQQIDRSIVDPNAEIAQGFQQGVMPTDYGQTIEPRDLRLLVRFLAQSAGQGGGGGGGGGGN